MKPFLLKILMLSYFLFSFINATHVHADGSEHTDDCKVCIIVKAFSDTNTPSLDFHISYESYRYQIDIFTSAFIEVSYLKGFFSHAPPFLFS